MQKRKRGEIKSARQFQTRQLFLPLSVSSREAFSINFARFSDSQAVGGNRDSGGQKKNRGQLLKESCSL